MATSKQHLHNKSGRSSSLTIARSPSHHFAVIELKQRIITSLNKLADRDTHQIALEDLETTIGTLTPEFITASLNCLYDTDSQTRSVVRKESVKLLGSMACAHPDLVVPHLPKIITHIVKRLKDPDSSVRDSCQSTFGVLSGQFLGGEGSSSALAGIFFKPLFEALSEHNKATQSSSALCLSKIIENAKEPVPVASFQKLCARVCKFLSSPNFVAKAQLLCVFGSLAQVGALSQQQLETAIPSMKESLESSDWATRKAAADTLIQIAEHLSQDLIDYKSTIISSLEAYRFDKIKPVRESVTEALQLWKNIPAGEDEVVTEESKPLSSEKSESTDMTESVRKQISENSDPTVMKTSSTAKVPHDSLNEGSIPHTESSVIAEKTVGILKRKVSSLSEKGLNPEFFQKLESIKEVEIEVAVPKGRSTSSQTLHAEEVDDNLVENTERLTGEKVSSRPAKGVWKSSSDVFREDENLDTSNAQRIEASYGRLDNADNFSQDKWVDRSIKNRELGTRAVEFDDFSDHDQRGIGSTRNFYARSNDNIVSQATDGNDNILMIHRQLLQMERQQASMMEMLQEFMISSQESMLSLENRVRNLERALEDRTRDFSFSSGRRGTGHIFGYEGQVNNRLWNKVYGVNEFSGSRFGRDNDVRSFGSERFTQGDIGLVAARGREMQWRSSETSSDIWDNHSHGMHRGSQVSDNQAHSRRGVMDGANDGRLSRQQEYFDAEPMVNRRGWDKETGPVRLGEGPSARSVWKAAKDEETLAAIRVAGEDTGPGKASSRGAVLELDSELSDYGNGVQGKRTYWNAWSRAMESMHCGDLDSAYSEVLNMGDEMLLVKLMSKSGPVLDQLSTGTVTEVLHAISQLLQQQSFFDLGIYWIQQVVDMVIENSPDCLALPLEVKKELLLSLHESSNMELPEDWEGHTVEELLIQLANAWSIDLPTNRENN